MDREERLMVQSSLEHLRQLLMTGQVKEAIKYLNESLTPIEEDDNVLERDTGEGMAGDSGEVKQLGVDSAEAGSLEQDQQSVGSEGGQTGDDTQDDTGGQPPATHGGGSEEDQQEPRQDLPGST